MTRRQRKPNPTNNGATTGYEAELWKMADALRGSMDTAEYKLVESQFQDYRWQSQVLP